MDLSITIAIGFNIGDKESSSDLETGAEPHRLELEEEFGKNLVFKKKICEAKRFFSLSPVQRFFRRKNTSGARSDLVSF